MTTLSLAAHTIVLLGLASPLPVAQESADELGDEARVGPGRDPVPGELLVTREATQWMNKQASPDPDVRGKSLALDSAGRPVIASSDDPDGDGWLRIACGDGKGDLVLLREGPSGWTRALVQPQT
jgi:hypothetical protein